MLTAEIGFLLGRTLMLILLVSLPAVGAGALVGLLVGLFQGLTQIQDQTISFALRLAATGIVLLLTGSWMASLLKTFAEEAFTMIRMT